jgi:hypothetical protein
MACNSCKTDYFRDKGCGAVVNKDSKTYCCPCVLHCRPVVKIEWEPR